VNAVTPTGVNLYYEEHGAGEPACILVPGFAADAGFWAGVVPALAAERRVLVLDPRGAGRSDIPDIAYALGDLAQDVLAVLRAADTGPVDVVGHSFGGLVAARLAAEEPSGVRSVVLFNPFLRLPLGARLALTAAGMFYRSDPLPMREMATALLPWLYSWRFLEEWLPELIRVSVENPHPQPQIGFERQLAALVDADASAWARRVGVPALVVAGERDLMVPPAVAAAVAAELPRADLVTVAGAGHCSPVEQPQECARIVLDFLAEGQ